MNRIFKRLAVPLSAAAVLGTAGFAYMASNTVDSSNAGQGTGTVSGYHVYDVHYPTGTNYSCIGVLNPTQPGQSQNGIKCVSFKVAPDNAGFAAVDIYDGNGTLLGGGGASNCSEDATSHVWTCNVGLNGGPDAIPVAQIAYVDVEAIQTS